MLTNNNNPSDYRSPETETSATMQQGTFTPLRLNQVKKYGACEETEQSKQNNVCKNQNRFGSVPCEHRVSLVDRCNINNSDHHSNQDDDNRLVDMEPDMEKPLVERMAKKIPGLGIIFALCASFFLGSSGLLVKLTTSVHGIQVAVFRSLIQLVIYGFIVRVRHLPLFPVKGERRYVLGRAILGGSSITFSYHALKLIPLGDATTIRFSLPIWTLIVGYFVLGESCSLLKCSAVVISVLGVILIAKPDDCIYWFHFLLRSLGYESDDQFEFHRHEYQLALLEQTPAGSELPGHSIVSHSSPSYAVVGSSPADDAAESARAQQLEGCTLALMSSVCLALSLIALRLCKRTPAEVTIIWLSLVSILLSSLALLWLDHWSLPDNWLDFSYIILNGITGSIGQWFITNALKIEQSGVIALARTCDIQVAFLYSALLLHEQIRVTSIIGSILVSGGVIAVVVPKWWESRRQNNGSGNSEESSVENNNNAFNRPIESLSIQLSASEGKHTQQLTSDNCCPCNINGHFRNNETHNNDNHNHNNSNHHHNNNHQDDKQRIVKQ